MKLIVSDYNDVPSKITTISMVAMDVKSMKKGQKIMFIFRHFLTINYAGNKLYSRSLGVTWMVCVAYKRILVGRNEDE